MRCICQQNNLHAGYLTGIKDCDEINIQGKISAAAGICSNYINDSETLLSSTNNCTIIDRKTRISHYYGASFCSKQKKSADYAL